MAPKYTAETAPYTKKAPHQIPTGSHASYTPSATINEHSYGRSGGKGSSQGGNVPQVQVGGSFEVGTLPKAFTGNFSIGENKNVSTPVSG